MAFRSSKRRRMEVDDHGNGPLIVHVIVAQQNTFHVSAWRMYHCIDSGAPSAFRTMIEQAWTLSVDEALGKAGVNPKEGLSHQEVNAALAKFGPNGM